MREDNRRHLDSTEILKLYLDPNKMFATDPWATREVVAGRAVFVTKLPNGTTILEKKVLSV